MTEKERVLITKEGEMIDISHPWHLMNTIDESQGIEVEIGEGMEMEVEVEEEGIEGRKGEEEGKGIIDDMGIETDLREEIDISHI